jgi:hypothetical protein
MQNHQRAFKTCMEAALATNRISLREFKELRNYNDFLLDEYLSPSPPAELAARALSALCNGDGQSMDRAVCAGVIQFLDRVYVHQTRDDSHTRQMIDSLRMAIELRAVGDRSRYDECRKWVRSWYE